MERQEEHPPEDVSWVQPTESLAFSVSPVGTTSSNARDEGDDAGRKSFSVSSRDGGDRGDEEDPPLRGEHIGENDDGEGKAGSVDDEGDIPVTSPPSQLQTTTPMGEAPHHELLSDKDNGGHSSTGHGGSSSPPPPGCEVEVNGGHRETESGGFANSTPCSQQAPWGQQEEQEQCHDNIVAEESKRALGYVAPQHDRAGSEERRRQVEEQAARLLPQRHWEDESRDGHEAEWADDDGEDFAPAWDQGRPAEFRGGSDGGFSEQEDTEQICRMDSSEDEEGRHFPHQDGHERPQRAYRRHGLEREDDEGSGMDVRSGSGYSISSNEGIDDLTDPPQHNSPGREESPSYRVVRRRTRVSLDRERRRLDRVPRSQRLSQVKGHPLGGMTLLQLEERHLLDVGIGQMARQLTKRQDRGGRERKRGVRQSNEDLLRRSARLLRRAQEERNARFSTEDARDFYHSVHASGGSPPPGVFCAGGGARSPSGGEEGVTKRGRRPASASRDRSCRRFTPSFSLEPSRESTRDRAHSASDFSQPVQTDAWGRALEGEIPPMGLYSGGGTRCSLKQRRPMSATPALTSGWEPGRTRAQGRGSARGGAGEAGSRWDCFGDDGSREAHFHHRGGAARGELGGHGEGDERLDYSDVPDLSPQGIVEYTDEEEGPFK